MRGLTDGADSLSQLKALQLNTLLSDMISDSSVAANAAPLVFEISERAERLHGILGLQTLVR